MSYYITPTDHMAKLAAVTAEEKDEYHYLEWSKNKAGDVHMKVGTYDDEFRMKLTLKGFEPCLPQGSPDEHRKRIAERLEQLAKSIREGRC